MRRDGGYPCPGPHGWKPPFYPFRQKAIIAGDTIFGDEDGNLYPPPEGYILDAYTAKRELKRLLFYDFDILLLSHGRNMLRDARRRVEML